MADITAARLNNLQSRIELILGQGSGTSGYGQTVTSSSVNNTSDLVDADHINNLYTDLVKARIHQVGVTETGIRQVIEDLNTIAEETSQQVNDDGVLAGDAEGTLKGIADYETLMNSIETDKLLVHPSQAALEPKITSTRTATWNGLIYHVFTITFDNESHRRHFFNAGGEIRVSANNTGATTPKGLDWAALCSEIGVIKFASTITTATGSGQGYAIGNNSLTSSYQTVFLKTGTGSYSGVYAGNLYTVKARIANSQVIEFRIEFNDVVVDNNVDNNGDGTLTSTVQQYRAVGATSVTVPTPTYFTTVQLNGFAVPQDNNTPTYVISTVPQSSVNEGGTITYTLTTTNVSNSTAVPYTITGVTTSDLDGQPLTGNFIVQNNTASLSIGITGDNLTEGAEQITLTLNNGAATRTLQINDTSTANNAYYYDPHWYNEFSSTYLANIPKDSAINIGRTIGNQLYRGNGQYTNALGQTRYGLFRRPGAAGPAYWTEYWYNTYAASGPSDDITQHASWPAFTRVFFSSADASQWPPGFTVNGQPIPNIQTNWESYRTTIQNKAFISGDGVGDFGNRGTPVSQTPPSSPSPPSESFAFTVTPASGMNFNVPISQGMVTFNFTVTCTAGSGSFTAQETSRPTIIPVAVDNSFSTGFPGQTTDNVASKTYALTAGQSRAIAFKIYAGAVGTWSGTFAILEATGAGQVVSKGWGGTFRAG
mgnify:FL=1